MKMQPFNLQVVACPRESSPYALWVVRKYFLCRSGLCQDDFHGRFQNTKLTPVPFFLRWMLHVIQPARPLFKVYICPFHAADLFLTPCSQQRKPENVLHWDASTGVTAPKILQQFLFFFSGEPTLALHGLGNELGAQELCFCRVYSHKRLFDVKQRRT